MKIQTFWPPPQAQRVLILAPHPDDEVIGCGGTISIYVSKKVDVRVVIISEVSGLVSQTSDVAELRKKETLEASRVLGIRETIFLGFQDGMLESCSEGIWEKIKEIVQDFRPEVVFAPSPIDHHPDHISVARVALRLLTERQDLSVAFYEVYQTIRFNYLVNITEVMTIKEQALLKYRHSLLGNSELYCDAVKGLNRFRAFYAREPGYYEAFWVISKPLPVSEVNEWLTYGMVSDAAAMLFLSKLKTVEKLLIENKRSEQRIISIESEAECLQAKLDLIESSNAWRAVTMFYRVRDRLLPQASLAGRLYDRLTGMLRNR